MSNEFEKWPSRYQPNDQEPESIKILPKALFNAKELLEKVHKMTDDPRIFKGTPTEFFEKIAKEHEAWEKAEAHPEEVQLPTKVQVGKLIMSVRDAGKNRADVPVVVLTSERGAEYSMGKSVFLYHLLIGKYKEVE